MKRFVLDCPISASWCLTDEQNGKALDILERLTKEEALVPSLWTIEMANILVIAERKGRITAADAKREIGILQTLPIVFDTENTYSMMEDTRRVAREYTLSAYDACYLALAQHAGVPLATSDRALLKAAHTCGVRVL